VGSAVCCNNVGSCVQLPHTHTRAQGTGDATSRFRDTCLQHAAGGSSPAAAAASDVPTVR
jgi:hypothetical protein